MCEAKARERKRVLMSEQAAPDDLALIRRIRKGGDEAAASALVRRYYREVSVFVSRQLIDQSVAEDVTQDAFVAALVHLGAYDPRRASFRTWLYRIATNKVIDFQRAYRATVPLDEGIHIPDPVSEADLAELLSDQETAKDVHARLAELPPRAQQIIRMRFFRDLTLSEIATELHMPESSAKSIYYRSLRTLKGRMSRDR